MPEHPQPGSGHEGHDHAEHDHVGCKAAVAELYLFLDGELTSDRLTELRSHLEDCSPCFEAFDFEAELRMVISSRCREQVPEELRKRILASLADGPDGHTVDAEPT